MKCTSLFLVLTLATLIAEPGECESGGIKVCVFEQKTEQNELQICL
uniref:Uncharacterized protein n=1 Tax=Monopterus albus TaxID=43700 RepID=A0A3Q3QC83_MONAL